MSSRGRKGSTHPTRMEVSMLGWVSTRLSSPPYS